MARSSTCKGGPWRVGPGFGRALDELERGLGGPWTGLERGLERGLELGLARVLERVERGLEGTVLGRPIIKSIRLTSSSNYLQYSRVILIKRCILESAS